MSEATTWSSSRLVARPLSGSDAASGAAGARDANCQLAWPASSVSSSASTPATSTRRMRSSPASSALGDSSKEALRTRSISGREPQSALPRTTSPACTAMVGRMRIDSSPSMRKSRPVAAFTWFDSSAARRSGGKARVTAAQTAATSRARAPSRIATTRTQRRFGRAAAVTSATLYFAPIPWALSSALRSVFAQAAAM